MDEQLKPARAVHEHEGQWWFWDEVWTNRMGPYADRHLAAEGLRLYCVEQLGCAPRPVLVGMNNPYGADPKYALYPTPEFATGWRIWQMIKSEVPECGMVDYRDRFERLNVMTGPWTLRAARAAAPRILDYWLGAEVLVLGAQTRDALRFENCPPLTWHERAWGSHAGLQGPGLPEGPQRTTRWAWVPHPSGRCRWYNEPGNKKRAAVELARLYRGESA